MDENVIVADESVVNEANAASENGVTPAELGGSAVINPSTGLLRPRRKKVSLDSRKARAGYIFTLPFILGVVLIYLPILFDSIWFSLGRIKLSQTV